MKDTEIHNGLSDQNIRDFLSQQLVLNFEEQMQNKKKTIQHFEPSLEWAIQDTEAHIEYLKKRAEFFKSQQAILILIEKNGWREFDVSDYVSKDYGNMAMTFIGTDKEHNNLIKKIEEDNIT